MAKNTPAFQFYPQDFLGGVMLLDNATTGIYIKLLSVLWISNNSLPLEFTQLARATHCDSPQEFLEAWKHIADKFEIAGNTISHPRFTQMIELREKRKASGSLGGMSRVANAQANAQASPKQTSSKVMKNEDRRMKNEERIMTFKKPSKQEVIKYATEASLQIDAEAFVDFYESKGWKIGRNPMKDWKACARNWSRRTDKETSRNASQLTLREMPRQMRNEVASLESAKRLIAKREENERSS